MINNILIKIYLFFYYVFCNLYKSILYRIGPICVIYHDDGTVRKNVTLNWYLGYMYPSESDGLIHTNIYTANGTDLLAYYGKIHFFDSIFSNIKNKYDEDDRSIKRKNIILMNGETPITFDLNKIDKYYGLISRIKWNSIGGNCFPIKDLPTIMKIMNEKEDISHIQIINRSPFRKEIKEIKHIDIDMLYCE